MSFETIKSFISKIKQLMPQAESVKCLFNRFFINKFGKITIKPVFVIVNNSLLLQDTPWLNTSKGANELNLSRNKVYELNINTNEKQFNNMIYYQHYINEIHNEQLINKVNLQSINYATDEEDLLNAINNNDNQFKNVSMINVDNEEQ